MVRINANTRSKVKPLRHVHHSYIHGMKCSCGERTRACKQFQCAKHRQGGQNAFFPRNKEKAVGENNHGHSLSYSLAIYFPTSKSFPMGLCSTFRNGDSNFWLFPGKTNFGSCFNLIQKQILNECLKCIYIEHIVQFPKFGIRIKITKFRIKPSNKMHHKTPCSIRKRSQLSLTAVFR